MTTPFELFEQGRLTDALEAAVQEVRNEPNNIEKRWELVTLLCFEGNIDRAETHVKLMTQQASDLAADLLVLHCLLKGEIARRQCFEEGRLPKFTHQPSDSMQLFLRALTELKMDPISAANILQGIQNDHVAISGICDGTKFESFRDVNEMTSLFFEAITMAGDYYWIPFQSIQSVQFSELTAPQDIIWRQADMTTIEQEQVTAYVSALYYGTHKSKDEMLKLGRAADFTSEPPTLGLGGRTFQLDSEQRPLAMVQHISFDH